MDIRSRQILVYRTYVGSMADHDAYRERLMKDDFEKVVNVRSSLAHQLEHDILNVRDREVLAEQDQICSVILSPADIQQIKSRFPDEPIEEWWR